MGIDLDQLIDKLKDEGEIPILKKQYCAVVLIPLFVLADYKDAVQISAVFWTMLNVVVRT